MTFFFVNKAQKKGLGLTWWFKEDGEFRLLSCSSTSWLQTAAYAPCITSAFQPTSKRKAKMFPPASL